MINFVRKFSTHEIFNYRNRFQEVMAKKLISVELPVKNSLPFVFDVTNCFGWMIDKYFNTQNFDRFYIKDLKLKEIFSKVPTFSNDTDVFDPINLANANPSMESSMADLDTKLYQKLYWLENASYLLEKMTKEESVSTKISRIYEDGNLVYCAKLIYADTEIVGYSKNSNGAFQNVVLNDKVYEHLLLGDKFSVTDSDIQSIYDRKLANDIPFFRDNPIGQPRILSLSLESDTFGFSIDGGLPVCVSDEKLYQKYINTPVFVSKVEEASKAHKSGMLVGDKILAINYVDISGLDVDVVSRLLTTALTSVGSNLTISVQYCPEEYRTSLGLIEFNRQKTISFDPAPKSFHPKDVARRGKRPLWRMGHNKKTPAYVEPK